jgi:hypothetical protein
MIDEVMGHAGGRHPEQGSTMGRIYRETTPEMVGRVIAAIIEARLAMVLEVAMCQTRSAAAASEPREPSLQPQGRPCGQDHPRACPADLAW